MKRSIILAATLSCGLSCIWILPKRGNVAPSSLSKTEINAKEKTPPLEFGEWQGFKSLPTAEERKILATDTNFIKARYISDDLPALQCLDGRLFQNFLSLSIVISGHDINNSIHRPERCLVAQGHTEMLSFPDSIETPKARKFGVQRITSKALFPLAETEPNTHARGFISYYYFVGHKRMTNSHYTRTIMDMKDRLLTGTDQQWSFVMVSASHDLGATPEESAQKRESMDKKIRQFMGELTDRIVAWDELEQVH